MGDDARTRAQDAFMADDLDVIVATNAFGMGIDKRDIRLVIHADVPRSPEAYYQEAGRGGRDGKPTRCVLLFNHADVRLQEFLIDASYPSADVLRGMWKLIRDDPSITSPGARPRSRASSSARSPPPGIGAAAAEAKPRAQSSGSWGSGTSTATVGAALRILERHGMLARDGDGNT